MKRKFGLWLISLGVRLAPLEDAEPMTPVIKRQLHKPTDAVVELNQEDITWTPEQHGNIVVAEPILMTLDRRINNGKM